jgi:hypothetical protein
MIEKKYNGKPRGGGGLGQGRSKKNHEPKNFRLDTHVVEILESYDLTEKIKIGETLKKLTATYIVEVALLELHRQYLEKKGTPLSQKEIDEIMEKKQILFQKI